MEEIDPATLELALRLGINLRDDREHCMSYVNACVCEDCTSEAETVTEDFSDWLDRTDDSEAVPLRKPPTVVVTFPWENAA